MSEIDSTEVLNLNPSQDLFKRGFDNGTLYTVYNFVNHELESNPSSTYFISEISSDRTEIRLSSNFLTNEQISGSYGEFKQRLDSADYFDEFYVAFEGNNYNIGINCFLDTSKEKSTVLVKLYDALPTQFKEKDEVYVVTKTAESKAYKINQDPGNPSTDNISPSILFDDGFELDNQSIIPNEEITSTFTPDSNYIELYIYDVNLGLLASDVGNLGPDGKWLGFSDYTITGPGLTDDDIGSGVCSLGPQYTTQQACTEAGGTWTSTNGGTCSLGPQYQTESECTEAGGIWTPNNESANGVCSLGPEYPTKEACIAAGGQWTPSAGVCSLGPQYTTQAACLAAGGMWSVNRPGVCTLGPQYTTQYACIAAGGIWHNSEIYGDATFLRGPNTNLEIKDFVNNSTVYKTKDELLLSPSTSSRNNLDYYLNQRGVTITPDYSKFDEFVNFSSAKQRLQNFYYKVSQIQSYEDELSILNSITGGTSQSISVTSSKATLEGNITNLIKNFDGYEYYLYYITGSDSYPKTGSKFPYELKDTGSTDVLNWLGSSDENSQYYGGMLLSASFYDEDNQNWLFYTVPEFIRENEENDNYITFCNMVGQSFDEIWLYTKAVSQKMNTTNNLDQGVPLDLAQPTIEGLGYQGFGNNYNNQDNYIGLTGENNGDFLPPTGSELITNYIAVNSGSIVNYWEDNYSFAGYVEQIIEDGFPYAIDKVSKEIYKRLYHNMAYLVKKKGTTAGLRQLINIWGIPSTILRINEFGGKDKDNSDDYDLWYDRYSYAYTPVGPQTYPSASMVFPWMPLTRNYYAENANIVPDNLQFRFKTFGIPTSSNTAIGNYYTQSLLVKKSDGDATTTDFDFGIRLTYEPQETGSYNGAKNDERNKYGTLNFFISGSNNPTETILSGSGIYLPFFDGGWWSVMLQRDQHSDVSVNGFNVEYTLTAGNKIYNGDDGDQIGFVGSTSQSSHFANLYGSGLYGNALYGPVNSTFNTSYDSFGTTEYDGIYLGGYVSGSTVGGIIQNPNGKMFRGSFQEFRYYSNDTSQENFNDFVMNPESIEGNAITGSESSFDIVNFRAPLGNELENNFVISASSANYTQSFKSLHPAVSGESSYVITSSFYNPTTSATSSDYTLRLYNPTPSYNKTLSLLNREMYLLDQPAIGIANRISNKIQVSDGNDFGNILSNQISIQQDYLISRSYTEDLNSLEVGFAPADEVNDDIIATYGHGVIGDGISDPRYRQLKTEFYPKLQDTEKDYLKKYTKGNVQDYIRLIKYIDDSLFKAIKAYVPARTSVTTGIIIKQNMLDRSRAIPTTIDFDTKIASSPVPNWDTPIEKRDIVLTSSISDLLEGEDKDGLIFGGTGGTMETVNYYGAATTDPKTGTPGTASYGDIPLNTGQFTQSYIDRFDTIAGQQNLTASTQAEFYTGEFSGSEFPAVTQSLFNNPFAAPSSLESSYEVSESIHDHLHLNVEFDIVMCGYGPTQSLSSVPPQVSNGANKILNNNNGAGNLSMYTASGDLLLENFNGGPGKGLIVIATSSFSVKKAVTVEWRDFTFIYGIALPKTDKNGNDITEYTHVGLNGEEISYPSKNYGNYENEAGDEGFRFQGNSEDAGYDNIGEMTVDELRFVAKGAAGGYGYTNLFPYRPFGNASQRGSVSRTVTSKYTRFSFPTFQGINRMNKTAPFFQFNAYTASALPCTPTSTDLDGVRSSAGGTLIHNSEISHFFNYTNNVLDPTAAQYYDSLNGSANTCNPQGYTTGSTIDFASNYNLLNAGVIISTTMTQAPFTPYQGEPISNMEQLNNNAEGENLLGGNPIPSGFEKDYFAYTPFDWKEPNRISTNNHRIFRYAAPPTYVDSESPHRSGTGNNIKYLNLPPNKQNDFAISALSTYPELPSTQPEWSNIYEPFTEPITLKDTMDSNYWMNSRSMLKGFKYNDPTTVDFTTTVSTILHLGQYKNAKSTALTQLKSKPIYAGTASIHTYPQEWMHFYHADGSSKKPYDPLVGTQENRVYRQPIPAGYMGNKEIIGLVFSKTSVDSKGNANNLQTSLFANGFKFGPLSLPNTSSFLPTTAGSTIYSVANQYGLGGTSTSNNRHLYKVSFNYPQPAINQNNFIFGVKVLSNTTPTTSSQYEPYNFWGGKTSQLPTTQNVSIEDLENYGISDDLNSVYYFDYSPSDGSIPINKNITSNDGVTGLKTYHPEITLKGRGNFQFSPLLAGGSINFDNSQYNALINNFNANRDNSYLMDVDFSTDPNIPVNQAQLIAGTAVKAEVPDSNYTSQQVIIPRYNGSRLSSANYNFPTNAGEVGPSENVKQIRVLPEFLNGDTGSWDGDNSYGNTAVIDKNPIYFAHFKESIENENLPGTFTFNIDQLIEAPFESIQGKEEFPKIVKIDGSNQNLQSTVSTFEVGRKAGISYDNILSYGVDYSKLKVGENEIYQGGLEFQNVLWNYVDQSAYTAGFTGSVLPTMSMDVDKGPEWANVYQQGGSPTIDTREKIYLGETGTTDYAASQIRAFQSPAVLPGQPSPPRDFEPMYITSSTYLHTSSNAFFLGGSVLFVSQSVGSQTSVIGSWYGPSLGVIHTLNKCIQDKIAFTGSNSGGEDQKKSPGVPDDNLKYDANNKNLYFCFDPSGSFNLNNTSSNNNDINATPINEYNNTTEPFLIEVGDEITIKYTIRTTQNIVYYQDFVVTGVPKTTAAKPMGLPDFIGYYNRKQLQTLAPIGTINTNPIQDNLFAKIEVYPDPESITPSISTIDGFQIKRRVNADDRVIIYQTPPPKSKGALSPSGEGFIIPNDLTAVQKLNVQSLITQLRAKNSFPPDESTNNLNSRS